MNDHSLIALNHHPRNTNTIFDHNHLHSLITKNMIQSIDLSSNVSTTQRFLQFSKDAVISDAQTNDHKCMQYGGNIGGKRIKVCIYIIISNVHTVRFFVKVHVMIERRMVSTD